MENFALFCQEQTITKTLVENIQSYFDKTYENNINELKSLLSAYEKGIDSYKKKEPMSPILL